MRKISSLTMFELVNQLLIVIKLQFIHFVYKSFDISHTCKYKSQTI